MIFNEFSSAEIKRKKNAMKKALNFPSHVPSHLVTCAQEVSNFETNQHFNVPFNTQCLIIYGRFLIFQMLSLIHTTQMMLMTQGQRTFRSLIYLWTLLKQKKGRKGQMILYVNTMKNSDHWIYKKAMNRCFSYFGTAKCHVLM